MSEPRNYPTSWASATHYARVDPSVRTVVSHDDEFSVSAEHYRNLAFRVEEEARAKPMQGFVLAVTSPEPATGKTLVSLNLALTLARGEGEILLVEGDLRCPTLGGYLQTFVVAEKSAEKPQLMSNSVDHGLWHVLRRHLTLQEAVIPIWGSRLGILLAGTSGQVDNVMAQHDMSQLLALARSRYKIVIIDSPPLILAAGRSASARSNRTLLVVRAGRTKRQQIAASLSLVNRERLLGMVLNATKTPPDTAYSHYHRVTADPTDTASDEPIDETTVPGPPPEGRKRIATLRPGKSPPSETPIDEPS